MSRMSVINRVTLKTLYKNKTRTIVTIIGVILSAAMITAVTTFISSIQALLIRSVVNMDGPWHAAVVDVPFEKVPAIAGSDKISKYGLQQSRGFALLEGGKNPSKPYIYVQAVDKTSRALYAFKLTEGRMPEKPNELVISVHISSNAGVTYKLGDTLTLNLGDRFDANGKKLTQISGYDPEENPESLKNVRDEQYTIVGIIERPNFEPFNAPGYTAVTFLDTSALKPDDLVKVSFCAKNPRNLLKTAPELANSAGISAENVMFHDDLLRFMGISDNGGFNAILYSMGAILIALIMIGSISLIYNAFAISVSERSKQFGMLSGVGATSRQLRSAVLFEACFISVIGIPLGILSGILGIGVTLQLLQGAFDSFLNTEKLSLSVSWISVAVAAVVGFATVLLSAWIPSRRAAKVSPMEAIRQTHDIRIKRRLVKTSRLTRRVFGMEGDLALKNFKRNRRRYRATVVSLFISIVLFVSAFTFTDYTKKGTGTAYENTNYDLVVSFFRYETDNKSQISKWFADRLPSVEEVDRFSLARGLIGTVKVGSSLLSPNLVNGKSPVIPLDKNKKVQMQYVLYTVNDEEFERYLKEIGKSPDQFDDPGHPRAVLIDNLHYYNSDKKKSSGKLFKDNPGSLELYSRALFRPDSDQQQFSANMEIAAVTDAAPLGIDAYSFTNNFYLIVSEKVFGSLENSFPAEDFANEMIGIKSGKPDQAETNLQNLIDELGETRANLFNVSRALQVTRNVLLVVTVFTYGFITLITLITVANVFNTISTNVNLRRREFAMLKSVGMTSACFDRMINFECIFYGVKALLYGVPASILVSSLIYSSVQQGLGVQFEIPWFSLLIATVGTFLIVFVTMLYSMAKVRKENIVDALKNENL